MEPRWRSESADHIRGAAGVDVECEPKRTWPHYQACFAETTPGLPHWLACSHHAICSTRHACRFVLGCSLTQCGACRASHMHAAWWGDPILLSDVERPCVRESENERSKPSGGVPALCLYLPPYMSARIRQRLPSDPSGLLVQRNNVAPHTLGSIPALCMVRAVL
jgi:hypothetical protein